MRSAQHLDFIMDTNIQPDIEIYIKSTHLDDISAWLNSLFDNVTITRKQEHSTELSLDYMESSVEVLIQGKVSGKAWTSLWFKSNNTPWKDDLECALAASTALNTQIRCVQASWKEEDDQEMWWKIEQDTKELITW